MEKIREALHLRKTGKIEEARQLLLQLTKKEINNGSVFYHCACVHDQLGLEAEAVPFYTKALTCQLTSEERQRALLGLGSTYRVLGQYEQARIILEQGIEQFPHANEFRVFYALVLYNLNETKQAMSLLLKLLGETTNDNGMKAYKKAILFYSDHLDELWK